MKTTIEVNGEMYEVDLDNLTEEEAKKYNININTEKKEPKGSSGWIITSYKIKSKFLRILFLLSLMAFFLCGFLLDDGWSWSWSLLLVTPIMSSIIDLFRKPAKHAFKTIMTLLVVAAFFLCGFLIEGGWAWSWVLFLLIPIWSIVVE